MSDGMRVLVCGGRNFDDPSVVNRYLDMIKPDVVIHGGATGADTLAGLWAESEDVVCEVYPAHWSKHGRAAGPIRNKLMLSEGKPDEVLAFPGGRGTANMIKLARNAGVPVRVVAV